ncbi:hypothetical protein ASG07_11625 [Sphingomonas sp. Leaf343]|nr:hypothetical protein ASG07_11625 [Sphingomonas sp. Leaf343]
MRSSRRRRRRTRASSGVRPGGRRRISATCSAGACRSNAKCSTRSVAARETGDPHLTLADINPKALFLSSINAEFAGIDHGTMRASRPG